MNYLRIIILGIFVLVSNIYSQNPPSDFQLTCTVSGSVPMVSI